jgi:prephenate dehydrogenase
MRLFGKVAIIGLGLIGGSLGLAIRKKRLARLVVGVSRRRSTLLSAKRRGAVDIACRDLNAVKDADLIILAAPVGAILKIAEAISAVAKPGAIVIDVGSTKKEIVSRLKKLFPGYVGAHPLAGSEKRGVLNADGNIFEGSLCILTPVAATRSQPLAKIKKLWNMLGSRVVYLKPGAHDDILAFVSHLPHLIAFSLVRAVPKGHLKFSASGFKDATRIASSDAEVWRDIFLSNRKSILKAVKVFRRSLSILETGLRKKDTNGLEILLRKTKKIRDSLR